jgi:magnesium chelatase accessory protein
VRLSRASEIGGLARGAGQYFAAQDRHRVIPADWPNRECSRFIEAGGLRWHVQQAGHGPDLLLLHGTGSASHSWRGLLPLLAHRYRVTAPDLPGHGLTRCADGSMLTLPGMARAVERLLLALGVRPEILVGHSAGAALALRLALDGEVEPEIVVGLNAALLPYGGVLAGLFQPLARLFAAAPLLADSLAARARGAGTVERLIESTGSRLPAEAIADYRRVLGDPGHVSATLGMMAGWDLGPLLAELPELAVPLVLVVGDADRTVSPEQAERIRRRLPSARVVRLARLGHLAHEEDPRRLAEVIGECLDTESSGDAPAWS